MSDSQQSSPSGPGPAALVSGSVALGALAVTKITQRLRHRNLPTPKRLATALRAPVRTMELMEGRARYYHRPGEGTPIVLVPSFNAAASSFEWRPTFRHLAATTGRPLYALDWLGFGISDRPAVRYGPDLFRRQLRRLLSERVGRPADVVALSLGGEYAAAVAEEVPMLVQRLVIVAPTSLKGTRQGAPRFVRYALAPAVGTGAFELLFGKLTQPESLRRFYAEQIFRGGAVPDPLVRYAYLTTHVQGASHAPRYFIQGDLFLNGEARRIYGALQTPTLLVTPPSDVAEDTVQRFELLPEVLNANPTHLLHEELDAGLMPHWETPEAFHALLGRFIGE